MEEAPFEPENLLVELERQGVDFLVIGGIATALHGAILGTTDVDVLCSDTQANLEKLAQALTALAARVRGSQMAPQLIEADLLRGFRILTFETRFGEIDILFEAKGGFTYQALRPGGLTMDLDGHPITVVALDDLIALKRASGRPQDISAAERLEALREIQKGGEGPGGP